MNPTQFVLEGDYHQKAEIGHWVIEQHSGHLKGSGKIAGQSITQHIGPVTLTETVGSGAASLSASLALPIAGNLPLGHFDLSKAGTYPISVKLDGGNWFKGTLTVS
jgi:hypothetical protein